MAEGPINLAVISNEPTPYRLHLHGRLARELRGVTLHSLFTHTLHDASAPWQMQIDPAINPVHFAHLALTGANFSYRAIKLYHALAQYLLDHQVQLVVLNGYNDLTRLLLVRWCKRHGIPVLLRGDSNVYSEGRVPPMRRLVKRYFLRWLLGELAGLMPMGTCGRAFYRLWVDHRLPTFLMPYEPDYSRLETCSAERRAAFMTQHELDPTRRRLLCCCRLVPVKRVDVLLASFAQLAAERPEWDLVVAGDGPLRRELETTVPTELRGRVRFVGFLQFEDTVACYHSCDVLVHPSEYEPWALVINEAVAAGLAVVATEVTGAAVELVRHRINGLLVPPGDAKQLTAALREATAPQIIDALKAQAAPMLAQWRRAADPVDGVRQAVAHFLGGAV